METSDLFSRELPRRGRATPGVQPCEREASLQNQSRTCTHTSNKSTLLRWEVWSESPATMNEVGQLADEPDGDTDMAVK